MSTGDDPLESGRTDSLDGGTPRDGEGRPWRRRLRLVRVGIPLLLVAIIMAGLVAAQRLREPARVSADQAVATALGHLRWQHPELHGWKVASVRYQDGGTRVVDPYGGAYTTDAAHPFHGWVVAVTAPPQATWAVIHGSVMVDGRTDKVQSSGVSELNPTAGIG